MTGLCIGGIGITRQILNSQKAPSENQTQFAPLAVLIIDIMRSDFDAVRDLIPIWMKHSFKSLDTVCV